MSRGHDPRDPGPREPQPRWLPTLFLSLGLHVAGFTLAVALPRLLPRASTGPAVYVVDLVSLPAGAASSAAPSAAPPASSAPKPAGAEKPIKLPERPAKPAPKKTPEPKKPEVKKPEAKATPALKPTPIPASTPSATAAGNPPNQAAGDASGQAAGGSGHPGANGAAGAGGTGSGPGDMSSYYLAIVNRRVESAWQSQKPIYPPSETGRRIFTATVRLTITSSGRVIRTDLVVPSGYEALDRSVLRAVEDAQPFPPFPEQLGSGQQVVQFAISLTPD